MTGRTTSDAVDWTSVVAEHMPRLRRVVARRVPADLIDDVVQETFLRAYRSRASLDADRPIGPWLNTIAIRVATDLSRSTLPQASGSGVTALSAAGPDIELTTIERVALIRRALAALSPRHRQLLESIALDGVSQVALAQREGVAPEVIRSTVLRARQRFRIVYDRLAQEHGLVGLGGAVKPALSRLRGRMASIEANLARSAELGAALIGLLVLPSMVDAHHAPSPVLDNTSSVPAGLPVDNQRGRNATVAVAESLIGTRTNTRLPGAGLGTEVGGDLRNINTFWRLHVDALEATVTIGTDDRYGRVMFEQTVTRDGARMNSATAGVEFSCDKPTPEVQARCAALERIEHDLRSEATHASS